MGRQEDAFGSISAGSVWDGAWAVELLHRAAKERPGGTENIESSGDAVLDSASTRSMLEVMDSKDLPATVSMAVIVSTLGPPAMGAHIEPSVERVLTHLNLSALAAVAEALAEMPLSISTIKGVVDPEVPDLRQLVLGIREPGDLGGEAWLSTLAMVGRVMENAVEARPEFGDDIASQVTFEV